MQTVAQFMNDPDNSGTSNLTIYPARSLLTFYNPKGPGFCTNGSTASVNYDEAVLFHEALHGFFGLNDESIQQDFHIAVNDADTINISNYINQYVFGGKGTICGQ